MLITALQVAPCIAAASAQSPASRADEEAIKALMIQTTDAFNAHDAKAWAQFCPDVALVHVTEMSGVTSADGQQQPPHRELSIRVVVKERGVWRITAFHNTIMQPSGR